MICNQILHLITKDQGEKMNFSEERKNRCLIDELMVTQLFIVQVKWALRARSTIESLLKLFQLAVIYL